MSVYQNYCRSQPVCQTILVTAGVHAFRLRKSIISVILREGATVEGHLDRLAPHTKLDRVRPREPLVDGFDQDKLAGLGFGHFPQSDVRNHAYNLLNFLKEVNTQIKFPRKNIWRVDH